MTSPLQSALSRLSPFRPRLSWLVTHTVALWFRRLAPTRRWQALFYVAALAPDAGELVSSLIANPPPGAPVPPILAPVDGYLFLDRAKFADAFAADVRPDLASFMADSQVPWGVEALDGKVTEPAWKTKPTWYLVTTKDKNDSARCPARHGKAAPVQPSSRSRAATRFMYPSPVRLPNSSKQPPRK